MRGDVRLVVDQPRGLADTGFQMSVSVITSAQALEQEMVALMRAVDADRAGLHTTSEDDPRVARVGEIVTLLECFFPDEYDAIIARHFVS